MRVKVVTIVNDGDKGKGKIIVPNSQGVYKDAIELDSDNASAKIYGTDIKAALDGKAPISHSHTFASLGAAAASHGHTIAQVESLQAALDGKTNWGYRYAIPYHDWSYKNMLLVDLDNIGSPYNQDWAFGSDTSHSTYVNCPPGAPDAFYGWREVHHARTTGASRHLVTVELHEQYPTPGRVWSNTYDKNAGAWYGWHKSSEAARTLLFSGSAALGTFAHCAVPWNTFNTFLICTPSVSMPYIGYRQGAIIRAGGILTLGDGVMIIGSAQLSRSSDSAGYWDDLYIDYCSNYQLNCGGADSNIHLNEPVTQIWGIG